MAADHQDQLITLLRENEGFPSVQPTHHPSVQLASVGSRKMIIAIRQDKILISITVALDNVTVLLSPQI